jgi:hypothetical protein
MILFFVITGPTRRKKPVFAASFSFFKWQFEKHLHFQLSTFNFQFFPHPGKMDAGSSLTACQGRRHKPAALCYPAA